MHQKSNLGFPKVRNVFWDKAYQKWKVEFRVGGRKIFAGRFVDFLEAKSVADALRPQYFPNIEERIKRYTERDMRRRERDNAQAKHGGIPWYKRPENKEKQRINMRNVYQRRREWYSEFMTGRNCSRCGHRGSKDNPLQWHHRDPRSKLFSVGRGFFTNPRERVLIEVEKCDLLCRKCHWKVHAEMRKKKIAAS